MNKTKLAVFALCMLMDLPVLAQENTFLVQDERALNFPYAVCPVDYPVQDKYGICHACDTILAIEVTGLSDCVKWCPKVRHLETEFCVLWNCPEDKPLRDEDGTCVAKKDEVPIQTGALPECPPDYPLIGVDGICYPCDYDLVVPLMEDEKCSSVCSNRKNVEQGCRLSKCPADKPLDDGASCYACDDNQSVQADNCSLCKKRNYKKIGETYWCFPNKCRGKSIRDINMGCHACDSDDVFQTKAGECRATCNRRGEVWEGTEKRDKVSWCVPESSQIRYDQNADSKRKSRIGSVRNLNRQNKGE